MRDLFRVTTIVPEFHGCKDVEIAWFVCDRKRPLAPYSEVIAGYDPSSEMRSYDEGSINEMFTRDEADTLVRFLDENYSEGSQRVELVDLPIPSGMFPVGAIPVGGPQDFYMLSDDRGDWPLPVQVWGYYDLSNHEPLPGRQADLARRRAFAGGTLIVNRTTGSVTRASDLDKIEPLH